MNGNGDVLNSWKEIAIYVGRGVRTVQRWEQELQFPVHRPRGKHRSAVIAFKHDIDLWLRTPHAEPGKPRPKPSRIAHETHDKLLRNTQLLILRTNALIAHSDKLQKQIAKALDMGTLLRTSATRRADAQTNWAGTTTAVKKEMARAQELGALLHDTIAGGGRKDETWDPVEAANDPSPINSKSAVS